MLGYKSVVKPTGGLVGRKVDSSIIEKNYFPNMNNIMKYDDYFGQRPGRTAYGQGVGDVMGYYLFRIGDYNKFLKFTTRKIYTRSSSGWTDVTGTALAGTVDGFVDACTVYDSNSGTPYVVFTNGINNIRKYTGSGNTSDLSAWTSYKARFVRYFNGYTIFFHLTVSGVRNGFQFRCSDIDLPNDSTGTQSQTFNLTKDKNVSDIVKVEYFGNFLAIYKTDCIYLLSLGNSQNIFDFDVAVHEIGLRAPRAVAVNKLGHFFLGYDDFYFWSSPNARPEGLATRRIRDRLFEDTNPDNLERAIAVYNVQYNKIRLYVPEDEYLNRIYELDLTEQTWDWWVSERSNITAAWSYLPKTIVTIDELSGTIDNLEGTIDDLGGAITANYPLAIEGDKEGKSWYEDASVYDDGSTAIDSFIETADEIYETDGVPFSTDSIRGVRFEAKGAQASGDRLYLYYSKDEGATWTQITSGLILLSSGISVWTTYIDLTSAWTVYEAHIDDMSKQTRYKFGNAILSSTFFIRKFAPITEDGDPE